MTQVTVTPVHGTRLHNLYPGQSEPQGTFVCLDLETGRLWADYNPEIGNAVPMDVWHSRTLRLYLPGPLLGDVATELLHELVVDAQILIDHSGIEWDGSNHIGRQDPVADESYHRMELTIAQYGSEEHYVQCWDAEEWLEPERDDLVARLVEAGRLGGVSSGDTPYELALTECDRIARELVEDGSEEYPMLTHLERFMRDCRESAMNILDAGEEE